MLKDLDHNHVGPTMGSIFLGREETKDSGFATKVESKSCLHGKENLQITKYLHWINSSSVLYLSSTYLLSNN